VMQGAGHASDADRTDPHATVCQQPGHAGLTDGREWRSPYYNEPAEPILGCQFDEAGEMPGELLATMFQTTAEDGSPLESEALAMGPTSVLPKQRAVGSIPIARSGSPLFGPFSDTKSGPAAPPGAG
jgi:hypothetical protein